MNNTFKNILLKLVQLPRRDQRWVLQQLNSQQREQFNALQGNSLLSDAYKFRNVSYSQQIPQIKQNTTLPKACLTLRQADPLFIAIILEQGQFTWEEQFLQSCAQNNPIKELLDTQVKDLKSATKSYLFQQWQNQLSFDDHLGTAHG
jgi:hypothetical protein